MTIEIFILLLIIFIALILFSFENIPAEMVAMGVLVALIITGVLPVQKAFTGFGSDAVVMIFGLLILTAALARTGVVDLVGRAIIRRTGENASQMLLWVMLASALMSAFISNTAATAFFIPVIFGVARRAHLSSSKFLMPLAFATILSSSVTLVATSTNIVVSGLMVQNGLAPLGMFELAPVGLPILTIGIVYLFFIGTRMIPERVPPMDPVKVMSNQVYISEVLVQPGSTLAGKTLSESGLGRDLDLTVLRVVRDKENFLAPDAELQLQAGDLLLVEGLRDEILKIRGTVGIQFTGDIELTDLQSQVKGYGLAEGIVMMRSPVIGRTLKGVNFRERYGLQVLAINRHGETISHRISQVVLQLGDILLVQGSLANISAMQADTGFRIIGAVNETTPNLRRAPIAVAAFVGALLLATFNIMSLPVAVILGVLVVFATRTITPQEAYREVEWKAIILIGCMLSVGVALEYTGAAAFLANEIIALVGHSNPVWTLGGFFILTMLLTQPMSNQAAAAVVVPIAIQAALLLQLNPRTFTVMIAVAASCSYLTPLEPACLMVYGPGDYRFKDFLKVGSILTVLIFFLAILIVPLIWPL
jgi:di/tricarboxylate transporter